MSTLLPLGRATCGLSWCAAAFTRTTKARRQRYCTKAHGEVARREARKGRGTKRSPAFVRDMLKDAEPGKCIFGCGNATRQILCKDRECINAYDRLWYHEKKTIKRAA